MRLFLIFTWLFLHTAWGVPSYVSFPSDTDWFHRESAHFNVLYPKGTDEFAIRALFHAERAYGMLTPIFPKLPPKTWILLTDAHDATNGYALDFPLPHMVLFASPPAPQGQLIALDNWLFSLILHEYVHVAHLYPAGGFWNAMRFVFGSWVVPNGLMPTHFHEGIAVLLETELTQGGRGRGSFFRMLRRMAVKEKVWGTDAFASLDRMEASHILYPQGATPYFFGYTLYKELWSRKGGRGMHDLTSAYSSNWPYFLNSPLEAVYQTTYPELWKNIFEKTGKQTRSEIEEIEREPLSELRYLTNSRYHKSDIVLSPEGNRLAFRQNNPEEGTSIEIVDLPSGKRVKKIDWSGGDAYGLCWLQHDSKDYLLALDAVLSDYYLLNQLSLYDVDKGTSSKTVLDKKPLERLHVLSCSGTTVLVYREVGGAGKVLEMKLEVSKNLATLEREWIIPAGTAIIGIAAGKSHYLTVKQGIWTALYRWNPGQAPRKLFSVKGNLTNLRRSENNRLLTLADFDGRDEIWEIFVDQHKAVKRVALLGGSNGFAIGKSSYFVSSYEHGGFDIAQATEVSASAKDIAVEPRFSDSPAVKVSEAWSYSPLSTLRPTAWVPSVFFVPDGAQIGAWIPGFDLTQRHLYNLFGGYDTRGLAFADLSYVYRFGRASQLRTGIFYSPSYLQSSKDFFKRWGAGVSLGSRFFDFTWELGPAFRRVESSRLGPANQSVGAEITLSRSFGVKTKPLAPAPVRGTRAVLSVANFSKALGSDDNYFFSTASISQYLEAPWWDRHVWFLNLRAGLTSGTSLYNSYFEGGGEILFSQARGFFLNRGFQPGLFVARRIFNLNLEYRFPIAAIERGSGLFPARLKDLSGALVADHTTFDVGPKQALDRRAFPQDLFKVFNTSVGAELKSRWVFFFYLPTLIRVGGYHGFGLFGETIYATLGIEAG